MNLLFNLELTIQLNAIKNIKMNNKLDENIVYNLDGWHIKNIANLLLWQINFKSRSLPYFTYTVNRSSNTIDIALDDI